MKRIDIDILNTFQQDTALLTAGTKDHFNTMTIGWGGLGTLWNKPVATVYVRPSRYTYEFMENEDYFTVSFYDRTYRSDLAVLGTVSGRDGDKVAQTSLTPEFLDNSVTFKQARLTLVCRKLYRQDMDLAAMPEDVQRRAYADGDVHTAYIGEVVDVIEK